MAAYPSAQREFGARPLHQSPVVQLVSSAPRRSRGPSAEERAADDRQIGDALVAQLIDQLAVRVAGLVADRLAQGDGHHDEEWYDSRHAAEYLGVHRDTLRKLVAARSIPAEQDGPGCKLYFRRSDLDAWRRSGGRCSRLASVA